MDKEKQILQVKESLRKLFKGDKEIPAKLIDEISFMAVTLAELRETINREGAVADIPNGNNIKALKEHPAVKTYNAIIRNYLSSLRQLQDLLPEEDEKPEKKDGMGAFLARKRARELNANPLSLVESMEQN